MKRKVRSNGWFSNYKKFEDDTVHTPEEEVYIDFCRLPLSDTQEYLQDIGLQHLLLLRKYFEDSQINGKKYVFIKRELVKRYAL